MSVLFSVTFAFIFVTFIAAALVGHALLIEALLRPFFASPARRGPPHSDQPRTGDPLILSTAEISAEPDTPAAPSYSAIWFSRRAPSRLARHPPAG